METIGNHRGMVGISTWIPFCFLRMEIPCFSPCEKSKKKFYLFYVNIIASAASSNDQRVRVLECRGNSGDLYSRQAKIKIDEEKSINTNKRSVMW